MHHKASTKPVGRAPGLQMGQHSFLRRFCRWAGQGGGAHWVTLHSVYPGATQVQETQAPRSHQVPTAYTPRPSMQPSTPAGGSEFGAVFAGGRVGRARLGLG